MQWGAGVQCGARVSFLACRADACGMAARAAQQIQVAPCGWRPCGVRRRSQQRPGRAARARASLDGEPLVGLDLIHSSVNICKMNASTRLIASMAACPPLPTPFAHPRPNLPPGVHSAVAPPRQRSHPVALCNRGRRLCSLRHSRRHPVHGLHRRSTETRRREAPLNQLNRRYS